MARNEQFVLRLAEHLYFHMILNPEDAKKALTFARRRRGRRATAGDVADVVAD
ncbi:MAG: hypothetical protein NTU94_03320 [Planctomycetota bacterium]|nr:hypothetical protein [Planctomycetota bacterium]